MRGFWITDMSMLTDEDGGAKPLDDNVRAMADFLGRVIAALEGKPHDLHHDTGVPCRRSVEADACPGTIRGVNLLDDPNRIFWECPVCEDAGEVFNFRGTPWDPHKARHRREIDALIAGSLEDPDDEAVHWACPHCGSRIDLMPDRSIPHPNPDDICFAGTCPGCEFRLVIGVERVDEDDVDDQPPPGWQREDDITGEDDRRRNGRRQNGKREDEAEG